VVHLQYQDLHLGTSYNVKVRLRATSSQTTTDSGNISGTTKAIASYTSTPNINFGDNPTIKKTNPSGKHNIVRIETLNPTTTIVKRTDTSDNMTITITDSEWDAFYKKLGNNNSITIRYVVDTEGNSTYHSWVDKTLTLKGNMKTMRTKVNSDWRRGKLWTNVNGTWRRGVIWTNVNGTWRRGI